ncbi:hypothetical protein AVEN_235361-1 [Araneus ventricosus]|uniref:THAP-type domain-containing protein n=1 Tax=Araneus ventricosus TaxID=182803 RepID=A0A4Y2A4V3_ARAVE|nr:hypothetical protein AVEN_235361-1 [Araneus ventricosus]
MLNIGNPPPTGDESFHKAQASRPSHSDGPRHCATWQDENLRRRWLQALNRKDFVITANSRVCIQHFSEDLVIKESSFVDSTTGNIIKIALSHFKLKEGAAPTIFPGCPGYMTKDTVREKLNLKIVNI